MNTLKFISKLIVGLVFTFSGFVKCIDPLGTAYKISEYMVDFGFPGLTNFALALSIIMCGLELLIGLMLLFNNKVNWAAWMALVFMLFYTPLTLYIAIANPVTDCGCFGDALVLTNWQTFLKNVVLIVFTIILFMHRNAYPKWFEGKFQIVYLAFFALIVFGFEAYSLSRLPVIDFRPYKIGVNIQEGMEIPEGADHGETLMTFVYQKDGVEREFGMDNLPDETWEFVRRDDKVIRKGYEPPIHDFSIVNANSGSNDTEFFLESGYVCILIAYDLTKAKTDKQKEINLLAGVVKQSGHHFISLTGSGPEDIAKFQGEYNPPYSFYNTDPTALKTIVRSNPGLVLLKNGTILNKWHINQLPTPGELAIDIQAVEY